MTYENYRLTCARFFSYRVVVEPDFAYIERRRISLGPLAVWEPVSSFERDRDGLVHLLAWCCDMGMFIESVDVLSEARAAGVAS